MEVFLLAASGALIGSGIYDFGRMLVMRRLSRGKAHG